jgi:hypothetical protein
MRRFAYRWVSRWWWLCIQPWDINQLQWWSCKTKPNMMSFSTGAIFAAFQAQDWQRCTTGNRHIPNPHLGYIVLWVDGWAIASKSSLNSAMKCGGALKFCHHSWRLQKPCIWGGKWAKEMVLLMWLTCTGPQNKTNPFGFTSLWRS